MATKDKPEKPDERDNFTIISDALQRYGGSQKVTADSRFICCPWPEHGGSDNSPSCGVYMKIDGKIPLGFSHCFGCSTRGTWNKLAEVTGWEKIKEWRGSTTANTELITRSLEENLLGSSGTTFKTILKTMRCEEAIRWPVNLDWRGYSGQLIHDVGGHIIVDDYKDSVAVLFPIKVNGKVRGGVKAVYERGTGKNVRAYINMPGEWVRNYGLFPYMYTQKLIQKKSLDFVFLVEGPRDALRLVSLGIPALSILGATSMSSIKAMLVVNLNVSHVYVVSDNDNGGDVTWKTIKKFIKKLDSVNLTRLKLPRETDKAGKLIKMDPGNMPNSIVEELVKVLFKNHGFVMPVKNMALVKSSVTSKKRKSNES